MKKSITIVACTLLLPMALMASDRGNNKEERFAEHKAKIISHIQKNLECVQSAKNREDMKACRKSNKDRIEKHREAAQKHRENRKSKQD